MKCLWKSLCGGLIGPEGRCLKCGRTPDLDHETMVEREQAKPNHIRGLYHYESEKKSRKKRELREAQGKKV